MADIVLYQPEQKLALCEDACRFLAQARDVQTVKEFRDRAEALQHYLKMQGANFESQQNAAELKVRAERRLGELLAETVRPGNPQLLHDATIGRLPKEVSRSQSHRWQRIAGPGEPDFEAHLAQLRQEGKEITTAGVMRFAKHLQQPGKQEGAPQMDGCTVADLGALVAQGKTFGTIYADPPWQYGNQATRASTDNHYQTMTIEEIAALPIQALAAENAHLHLWTTNAFLFECPRIFEAWGFEYKSVFVWVKPQIGMGNYWRVAHEFLLLGVRGSAVFKDHALRSWAEFSWGEYDRGEHSNKPEQVRHMIERASPGPFLELFGRLAMPGWAVWGNEIEKDLFSPEREVV